MQEVCHNPIFTTENGNFFTFIVSKYCLHHTSWTHMSNETYRADWTNYTLIFVNYTSQNAQKYAVKHIFLQIIWLYQKYAVPLHRVFHGIRFKVK